MAPASEGTGTAGTLPAPATAVSPIVDAPAPLASWMDVPSANRGQLHNELRAVGTAGSAVWAVGLYYDGTSDAPLIERFSGTSWKVVSNRSPSAKHAELDGVAGASPVSAWSVGRFEPALGQERTLVEHWNGIRWSIVSSPNRGAFHNELDAVVVRREDDVWAVGHSDRNSHNSNEALIEHWNGRKWAILHNALLPGAYGDLVAMATVPRSSGLWAVGEQRRAGISTTLIEHWNGHQWSVVPSPNYGRYPNVLTGVVAVSGNDAWAVGTYSNRLVPHAVIEHWNGRYWSLVRGPSEILHHYSLSAVTYAGGHRIIAVGQVFSGRTDRTLIIESNGRGWTVDQSADEGAGHNQLNAVVSTGDGAALAVGTYFDGRADRALVLTRRR